MKRPVGVTILAVLAIIFGVVQLLGGVGLLGVSLLGLPAAFTVPGMEITSLLGSVGVAAGIAALVMAAVYVLFGVGAWMLKSWAWTLGVVIFGISLIVNVVLMFTAELTVAAAVTAVVAATVLAYLFTNHVRTAFGHEHGFFTAHRPMTHV